MTKDYDKIKEAYDKLKEKYKNLVELNKILSSIGYLDDSAFSSIIDLYMEIYSKVDAIQNLYVDLLMPSGFTEAHEAKFSQELRKELIEKYTKISAIKRKMSYFYSLSIQINDLEKIVKTLNEVIEDFKEIREFHTKIMESIYNGWEKLKIEEEEVTYMQ